MERERNPDLPRLRELLPLVVNGTTDVRPFRGLRKPITHDTEES